MNRKSVFALLLALTAAVSVLAELTPSQITNISCAQRWPWNGKVDINYTLTSNTASPVFRIAFYGKVNNGEDFALDALEGDGACGVTFGAGTKRVTWDASADAPNIDSSNVKVGIIALDVTEAANYLVLDLNTYTMSYNMGGPDVENDVHKSCKTWKLWFKRINAGTFMMGSASDEPGREPEGYREYKHQVTITKPFYIGVFECTDAQYQKINAEATSTNLYPKIQIKREALRGTNLGMTWPTYTDHRVDANSFFGRMRQKTGYGLKFDLPTEAQWEMAARDKGDGTYHGDKVWNDGSTFWKTVVVEDPLDPERSYTTNVVDYSDLDRLGWYQDERQVNGFPHEVGTKAPGINGLYDIHGNVWEYCLDRQITPDTSPAVDPVGDTRTSNKNFVIKGGSIFKTNPPNYCRMAMRLVKNDTNNNCGFRIVIVF